MKQRLNSTAERTVADFEGGTLPQDAVGNTADASVQSTVALEGNYSLEISISSGSSYLGFGNRPSTPQFGDSWTTYHYITDGADNTYFGFLKPDPSTDIFNSTGARCRINAEDDLFHLEQYVDGSQISTNFTSSAISNHLNEVLRVEWQITSDGSLTATLYDSNGSELGTTTLDIDSRIPTAGNIQYTVVNLSTATTQYFDGPFIERRETEARANTLKGTTQLGNEVVPSGSIQTGPQEVPPDHPNYPRASLPVSQDATDFKDVSYYDALNETPVFGPQGKAGPNGSIRHHFAKAHEALALDESATYIRDDFEDKSFQSNRSASEKLIVPEVSTQETGWSFLNGMYRPEWTVEQGTWSIRDTSNVPDDDSTVLLGETGQQNTLSTPSTKVNGSWIIRWGNQVDGGQDFYWYLMWEDSNNWIRGQWNHESGGGPNIVKSNGGTVSDIINSNAPKGDFLGTFEFRRTPDGTWEYYDPIGTDGFIPSDVSSPRATAVDSFLPSPTQTRLEHGGNNEMEVDWIEVR